MTLDGSTGLATSVWLTVVLIVVLASIASYTLSRVRQASGLRPRVLAIASIAAILLLAGAVLIVLTSSHLRALLPGADAPEPSAGRVVRMPGASPTVEPTSRDVPAARAALPSEHSSTTAAGASANPDPSTQDSPPGRASSLLTEATRVPEPNAHVVPPASGDPWAATSCVRSYRRDPQNASRWTIENECSWPVAIVLARCDADVSECDVRAQWTHEPAAFVLPMKGQRPVFAADETREGRTLRMLACYVLTPRAIGLIGEGLETRSTALWREEWDAVRLHDECLARVDRLSEWGRRTGRAVEATAD